MRQAIVRLIGTVLVFGGLAITPRVASAKCGSGPNILPGLALVVDGVVIGEYVISNPSADLPPSSQIAEMRMVCREVGRENSPIVLRQDAIVVYTRAGYAGAVELFLRQLAEAQQARYAATGSYTAHLRELPVIGAGIAPPLEMTAANGGWSAVTHLPQRGLTCEIRVASAVPNAEATAASAEDGAPRCTRDEGFKEPPAPSVDTDDAPPTLHIRFRSQ